MFFCVDLNQVPINSASLGHHRTKSNPDPLGSQSQIHTMTPVEACKRLIAAESLQDIYKRSKSHPGSCDVDSPHESPSGTPPPPYRGIVGKKLLSCKIMVFLITLSSVDSSVV